MRRLTPHAPLAHLRLIALFAVALLWLIASSPVFAAGSVPSGAKEALAPVTRMIGTLVAIAIGLGVAICGAVIVWGGIEKTLAGANQDAEHRASRRIQNGIQGLVWAACGGHLIRGQEHRAGDEPGDREPW